MDNSSLPLLPLLLAITVWKNFLKTDRNSFATHSISDVTLMPLKKKKGNKDRGLVIILCKGRKSIYWARSVLTKEVSLTRHPLWNLSTDFETWAFTLKPLSIQHISTFRNMWEEKYFSAPQLCCATITSKCNSHTDGKWWAWNKEKILV